MRGVKAIFKVNGESLRQYCLKNNIPYSGVYHYIQEKRVSGDEALALYLKSTKGHSDTKYFYEEQSLFQWCRINKLNYHRIMSRMRNLHISIEDSIKKEREKYESKTIKRVA